MQFEDYTTDDFLMDDSFVAYRTRSNSAAVAFWTEWQRGLPPNLAEFREAERLFDVLSGNRPELEQSLEELKGLIADREKTRAVDWQPKRKGFWRGRWLLAACVLLVCGLGGYWLWQNLPVSYETAYGEQRVVPLPDGSQVTLNSHSRLTFRRNWSAAENREVTLDGEGFFVVRHLATNAPFRVLTADAFRVEVLGTEFTMTHRDRLQRVVLHEGKVQVSGAADGKNLELRPGQLAERDTRTGQLSQRTALPERYNAWLRNQLSFDGATLPEAVRQIEEQFGVQIRLAPGADAGRRFTGILPMKDPLHSINIVAKYNGLTVRREADAYVLTR
ncbi:FecR family protein [Larkinella arboricola]